MSPVLSSFFSKKNLQKILLGFAVSAALLGSYFKVLEPYELQTYDLRCQIRGPRPVSPDIVLIEIANDTLAQLGRWPFDREYHASLIDILGSIGVRAAAFDILFVESSPQDSLVIEAAKNSANTYFPVAFTKPRFKDGRYESSEKEWPIAPGYGEATKGISHVNVAADIDGKRRRAIPKIYAAGKDCYQLAFRVAMDLLNVPEKDVVYKPGKFMRLGAKVDIPLDEKSQMIVSYAGKWETTFKHYSYLDIIAAYLEMGSGEKPRIDLNELKGKICFIGLTAAGSHDISPITIQPVYPMVGLHANVLNAILMNDFIRRADPWVNLLILLFFAALISWISSRHKPIIALLWTLGIMLVFAGIAMLLFFFFGVWIDLFYPLLMFILVYAVSTFTRTMTEMRKRELIENELKIASQIQRSFLPETLPELEGFQVAVYMKPAKAVGGDLYTFIKIGDRQIGVMAGDVSGKGTPAALFMAKAVSEFKFSARDLSDPSEALMKVNNSIASESTGGLFVTMSYAIFDVEAMSLKISNGGHLPMVVATAAGASELLLADEGMPIGVMPDIPFANSERALVSGDCFAFYSDGVSEARNKKADEYSIERLQAMIQKLHAGTAKEILDGTVEDLNEFMGTADQHDDITLLIVKVDKKNEK